MSHWISVDWPGPTASPPAESLIPVSLLGAKHHPWGRKTATWIKWSPLTAAVCKSCNAAELSLCPKTVPCFQFWHSQSSFVHNWYWSGRWAWVFILPRVCFPTVAAGVHTQFVKTVTWEKKPLNTSVSYTILSRSNQVLSVPPSVKQTLMPELTGETDWKAAAELTKSDYWPGLVGHPGRLHMLRTDNYLFLN